MSHRGFKAGAALAVGALTAGLLTATPTHAAVTTASRAGTDSDASRLAATWLKGELTDGIMVGQHGPDYGLTLDTGLALANVGDTKGVATISDAFEPKLADYIGDGGTESYGGPVAKAATFARAARKNPTSYGGVNLVTRLEERVADAGAGATAGRLSDKSQYGDYANVVGQSYAARALHLAGSSEAAAATSYLLAQQCTSGYFRLYFSDPTAAAQGCVEGAAGSAADPDATSLAVINLVESGDTSAATKAALARAGAWLAERQRKSGAVRGGTGTAKINSNSTSIAGYAMALLGDRDGAMRAATWVRKNQPVDKYKCRTALTKELGAVAYRWGSAADARTGGIAEEARDEWRRATAQAVPALQWAPAPKRALTVQRARRMGRAGTKVRFRTLGLAPGERGCVQIKGDFKRVSGKSSGGKVVRGLRLPVGNRWRVVIVKTAEDKDKVWIKVRN